MSPMNVRLTLNEFWPEHQNKLVFSGTGAIQPRDKEKMKSEIRSLRKPVDKFNHSQEIKIERSNEQKLIRESAEDTAKKEFIVNNI